MVVEPSLLESLVNVAKVAGNVDSWGCFYDTIRYFSLPSMGVLPILAAYFVYRNLKKN